MISRIVRCAAQSAAICLRNVACPASLEIHTVYRVLPDPEALGQGFIWVVDKSGEDYLYPEDYFVVSELPEHVAAALQLAA